MTNQDNNHNDTTNDNKKENSKANSNTNSKLISKDKLGLYNDIAGAANNLVNSIRGKKPNSTQRGILANTNNNMNNNETVYKGELGNNNSQNALERGIDPQDVMLSKSVGDVSKEAREQFFSSASDLLVTQTALVFDKLLDLATYATLGYHTMSKVTKEDLIDDLKKKRDVMVGVMKDPKGRKIVRDIAYVSAKMLAVIISAVEKPVIQARDKILNIVIASSDKIMAKGVILMKNLVKIVPGIGDIYILLDNGLQMTKAASEMVTSGTKAANIATQSFIDASESISKVQKPLNQDFKFLESSLEDFHKMREKIRKNTQLPDIDQTTQHLKRTIRDIGNESSKQIQQFRDKLIEDKSKNVPMTGGKTLKNYRRKTKSKRIKGRKKSKNMTTLKSCMKDPGCNLRKVLRKTKKKCVQFDL